MAMVHPGPTHELASLHSAMDRLFTDIFGDVFRSPQMVDAQSTDTATYHLPLNVIRTENGYRIEAPLPGWRPEDVEGTFSEGILSINARRSEGRSRRQGQYLRQEVAYGNFGRQIMIPGDVRASDIKASFENGVLTIDVPRAREAKPAQIKVQASERTKQLSRSGPASGRDSPPQANRGEPQSSPRPCL